ncbi:hypothetical protein MHK_002568 [Candidatus Magnetomorum sp. HK-1]|nr:hypothetical protein MHK_002568 [Candidatus Magnetomorum sp. HK-1]
MDSSQNIPWMIYHNITRIIDVASGEMYTDKFAAIDTDCDTNEDTPYQSSSEISPGECVIYLIEFMNQGAGYLFDIRVQDEVPAYNERPLQEPGAKAPLF